MQHGLLNKEMRLVQILDDELVVVGAVDVHQDRLDGRLALDEHAWRRQLKTKTPRGLRLPRTALTILLVVVLEMAGLWLSMDR